MFKSRVNQPSRLFVNSNDDLSNPNSVGFNSFSASLQTPVLAATKLQLLRATIPNALQNIPDYCLTFWYYQLSTATTAPADGFLFCVRLYPSYYVPPSGYTKYTKNRTFSGPNDFVSALNAAASTGGDEVANNPYWGENQVSFAYNSTTNQITMTGLSSGKFYAIAGWNDSFVQAAQRQGTVIQNSFNGPDPPQPFALGYTLNLRVGYTLSGNALASQTNAGNPLYANLTNTAFAQNVGIPPDSYPNLVYTGSVYLYSDVVAGSSLGSGKQHNLLAVIPNNTAQLGVIQYVAATLTWLTKIPDTIYEVNIQMFDDANQPFVLPDSAVVNVELGFGYD